LSKIKHIVNGIVWTVVILYFSVIALVQIPFVQSWLGMQISSALQHKLGTHVSISHVDMGFLNRVIIDGITIYDQQGKQMLSASRFAAKIDYYGLINSGKVSVSSAQVFGVKGCFYRRNASVQPNYQFMLDSLSSKDTTKSSSIELMVNSLIVRHGSLTYDQYDAAPTPGRLNFAHLSINDISAHLIIPYYSADSLNTEIKKLSMSEHSGFVLNNLSFRMEADAHRAEISELKIKLPKTNFYVKSLMADYIIKNQSFDISSLRFNGIIRDSKITPSDFSALVPALKGMHTAMFLSASFNGTCKSLNVSQISIKSQDKALRLEAKASLHDFNRLRWETDITHLECNMAVIENTVGWSDDLPEAVRRLGTVKYNGHIEWKSYMAEMQGTVITDAGTAVLKVEKRCQRVNVDIQAHNMNLQTMTGNDHLGIAEADLKGFVLLSDNDNKPFNVCVDGLVQRFDYNGYSYRNITLKGTYCNGIYEGLASLDDLNGQIALEGKLNTMNNRLVDIKASVCGLDLAALNLTDKWRGNRFSADLLANIDITHVGTPIGTVRLRDFSITSTDDSYCIKQLDIMADKEHLTVSGDIGRIMLTGRYNLTALAESFTDMLSSKLPTLFSTKSKADNNYVIDAEIVSIEWLKRLFNVPLTLNKPLIVSATVNDNKHRIKLLCRTNGIEYNGGKYEAIELNAHAPNDTLFVSVHASKIMNNGHRLGMNLNAAASGDKLITTVNWNNHRLHPIKGTLSAETAFECKGNGNTDIHINILPSDVIVSDTVWNVLPANIKYSGGNLEINDFAIEHNRQYIHIGGLATRNQTDSITVDLKDVDVNYILNLVNFHTVEFSGLASGRAYIKSMFFAPNAYADINVHNFCFENGRMGDLQAHVNWNKADKQIDISATAKDKDDGLTQINGYVSPVKNHIDIGIKAHRTNIEFLESFCGSFMDNIHARANGTVRLAGPLSAINLTGILTADGTVHVSPLNVNYSMQNDTIRFIPDNIMFVSDTIRDNNGNIGIIDGTLHHRHLTNLTYNINVRAQHLLCYNTHSYGDNTFYGRAIGSGLCTIQGGNGKVDINVNITPEKESFIEYNAASPESISDQEYITWRDATPSALPSPTDSIATDRLQSTDIIIEEPSATSSELSPISSDMRINFTINATPDATLRVLMDQQSGDHISLNGTGVLHASYFNKGSFDMFGNYQIDHGLYKLTIQNLLKKEFQFQQGSTIIFGGDPLNASLSLKALYTINGVPLSDLHLGHSFTSNNVRVDCMMNISGTPQAPRVDFDIDLPTVNSDAKQMVKTVINSEEEMNQQVIYLLSVGRFYIQEKNNADYDNGSQSQTSLAMQSLLSGTISQQINSLLGSLVKNNNWSFGANISTGDEGFNNAEYEGLLQGRLLNNRLIINGQFGYRDNANATTSFIGDFDISYLLFPSGNLAIKVYNQTNDRYFTKSSLNTQGIGLIMKKDFNTLSDLFGIHHKRKMTK